MLQLKLLKIYKRSGGTCGFPFGLRSILSGKTKRAVAGRVYGLYFLKQAAPISRCQFCLNLGTVPWPLPFVVIRNLKIHPNTFPFLVLLSNLGLNIKRQHPLQTERSLNLKTKQNKRKSLLSLSVWGDLKSTDLFVWMGCLLLQAIKGCDVSGFELLYFPLLTLALFGVCGCLCGFLSGSLRFICFSL